jgi:Family of unknown function (DUF6516)
VVIRYVGWCVVSDEHTLEFLLAFDGRVHHLERGYWVKFEIGRVKPTAERPHGLSYSFTLHDADGNRLVGFDNAHRVPSLASGYSRAKVENDHWRRTGDDPGRPYVFTTADQLLADFFAEARRVLNDHGISDEVMGTSESQRKDEP